MSFQDTYTDTTVLLESRERKLTRIDPAKTPVFDSAEVDSDVNSQIHSWDEDDVVAAGATNKSIQGADYTYTSTAPTKGTNYTQLIVRADKISYTNQAVEHPAIKNKVADKAMWLLKQAKLDAEYSMINGAKAAGAAATAAEMGGLKAFAAAGTTDAAAGGTVLTLALFTAFLKKGWDLGAEWDRVLMNGLQKSTKLDAFAGINYQRNTDKMSKLVTHWDTIETAFCTVEVIPHRDAFVASGQMVAYQKDYVKKGVLQSFQRDMKVAPTGTAIPVAIFGEYTLVVKNVKAVGKASGYTG